MDFIINQVMEFQIVHETNRNFAIEILSGTSVTKLNLSILSLMRQCTDYALRYSHNSERWFAPVLEKKFFD